MSTIITGKLNRAANRHDGDSGTNFFVSLGVKSYDRKEKADVWTNYDAALFAKAGPQVEFYEKILVEGSIIEVSSTGVILRVDAEGKWAPKLEMQDAKLGFFYDGGGGGAPAPSIMDENLPF